MTNDDFMPDEIRPGRRSRFRFTQTPQWTLLMLSLSDAGYRAYSLLLAHVNTERDDTVVWPHQKSLAAMLGKRPEAVSRVINKELKPLGLVDVEPVRYGANKSRQRNIYTVHEEPPEGWEGCASISEWYATNRPEVGKAAGQAGQAKNREPGGVKDRVSGDAKDRVGNYTNGELHETGTDSAPSARSAADVRRTGAGSSAREAESGSAATGKASSSSGKGSRKARVPRPRDDKAVAEAAACREVEASLPPALVALLPYGHIPKRNRKAVLEALDSRTPQQLADRAARRWLTYRYEVALHDEGLRSPVGVALELIAPTPYCPDPSCEDGIEDGHLGGKAECTACVMRRRDRRDARRKGLSVPTGRFTRHAPIVECADCQRPLPAGTREGVVCARCTYEAAAAFQAITEQWAAEEQERADQRAAEAAALANQEQQRAAAAAEDEGRARELADRLAAEAAETARLREQIAAENPALAEYGNGTRYPTAPAADQLLDEARAAIAAAKTARATAAPF